jgi:hypothetical protein
MEYDVHQGYVNVVHPTPQTAAPQGAGAEMGRGERAALKKDVDMSLGGEGTRGNQPETHENFPTKRLFNSSNCCYTILLSIVV